jgi:Ca2+/H+ antiporter
LASRRRRGIIAALAGHGTWARQERETEILDSTATVIILIVVLIIYMLPTLIAYGREHPRRQELTVINIFLGWTLIGWLAVFLWAALARVEDQPA